MGHLPPPIDPVTQAKLQRISRDVFNKYKDKLTKTESVFDEGLGEKLLWAKGQSHRTKKDNETIDRVLKTGGTDRTRTFIDDNVGRQIEREIDNEIHKGIEQGWLKLPRKS